MNARTLGLMGLAMGLLAGTPAAQETPKKSKMPPRIEIRNGHTHTAEAFANWAHERMSLARKEREARLARRAEIRKLRQEGKPVPVATPVAEADGEASVYRSFGRRQTEFAKDVREEEARAQQERFEALEKARAGKAETEAKDAAKKADPQPVRSYRVRGAELEEKDEQPEPEKKDSRR